MEQFKEWPFALVGINSDGPPDAVVAKIREKAFPWRNALDGSPGRITTEWNVRSMPMIYVLDMKGVIAARGDLYEDALTHSVNELLQEWAKTLPPRK
jgi:hypothetical protein